MSLFKGFVWLLFEMGRIILKIDVVRNGMNYDMI